MDSFFATDVKRAAIQTMETLYILETSKNIDTIKGRHSFLLKVIQTLRSASSNSDYATIVQGALDQFKAIYPTSVPQSYQLAAISDPHTFDVNEFYCISLGNAIKRYCEQQSEEIKGLKRDTAKAKRLSKVLDTVKSTQSELETKCSSASSFTNVLDEFKTLAANFASST